MNDRFRNVTIGVVLLVVAGCEGEKRHYDRIAVDRIDSVQVRDAGAFYSVSVWAGEANDVLNCDKPMGGMQTSFRLEPGDSIISVYVLDHRGNEIRFVREVAP